MTLPARPKKPDSDFEHDPRYAVANREALLGGGFWLAFTVVISLIAWLIGAHKKASELTFVLGFPAWFFWSCLVATILLSLVPAVLVSRYFTDMPLSADGDPSNEEK
jgi:uncharacterized membrane protein YhdT